MRLRVICRICGDGFEITVSKEAYERWKGGELIQDAMPELDEDARELLISRTCGICWDTLFEGD